MAFLGMADVVGSDGSYVRWLAELRWDAGLEALPPRQEGGIVLELSETSSVLVDPRKEVDTISSPAFKPQTSLSCDTLLKGKKPSGDSYPALITPSPT